MRSTDVYGGQTKEIIRNLGLLLPEMSNWLFFIIICFLDNVDTFRLDKSELNKLQITSSIFTVTSNVPDIPPSCCASQWRWGKLGKILASLPVPCKITCKSET